MNSAHVLKEGPADTLYELTPRPTLPPDRLDVGEGTGCFADLGDPVNPTLFGRSFKVMMVDDEPVVITFMREFLEQAGFSNIVATSQGAEAVALARSCLPDIVLLDLTMPEVDGFEVLARIRSDSDLRYVPVIIVSGNTDSQTKLKALEMGAADILHKPVDPSELRLRVRNALAFKASGSAGGLRRAD